MSSLRKYGFEILRAVFSPTEVAGLRQEAERVSREAGTANVRLLSERSDRFCTLSRSGKVRSWVGGDRQPVRSILFDKTPERNWPVLWHQDLTIAVRAREEVVGYQVWSMKNEVPHVQPPLELLSEMATVRIHLDPTPESNGALKVIPGSHRLGRMSQESIAGELANTTETVCECESGDVLLMSPLILHSSGKSWNPSRRRVLHFEYAKTGSLDPALQWREE